MYLVDNQYVTSGFQTRKHNSLIYSEELLKIFTLKFGYVKTYYYLYYVIKMIKYEFKY